MKTPLHYACEKGAIYMVDLLIKKGANIYDKDYRGWSCIHYAIASASLDVFQYLLQIDNKLLNASCFARRTPLHYACLSKLNQSNLVQTIIEWGADINALDADGRKPLEIA